jgi:3-ketosteroid 9alpha-monooxygenase subunit A
MAVQDPFAGFARGWFVIAFSDDIGVGIVRPLNYFGTRLVAFRGASGKVNILDAHCPHLGADLGVGGTVEGDTIRCPFHAWRFDGQGTCVDVPYATKIPKGACLRTWPVLERNGVVFVWHDSGAAAPDWEIPVLPECDDDTWSAWSTNLLTVATQPKEIVENVADKAHFPTVHRTIVERFSNEFSGHLAIQHTQGVAHPKGGGTDQFELTATYYGPAYQISVMDGVLQSRLLLAHTPIDEHSLDLRFGVMLKEIGDADKTARFAEKYVENLTIGFHEDIEIWENKRYRSRPALCEGDGPIGRLRVWYRQFYGDAVVRESV